MSNDNPEYVKFKKDFISDREKVNKDILNMISKFEKKYNIHIDKIHLQNPTDFMNRHIYLDIWFV